MFKTVPFFLLFVMVFISGCQNTGNSQFTPDIRADEIQLHIEWLADEARSGRLAGSHSEAEAANYIADHFRNFAMEPSGDDGTWFQPFVLSGAMAQVMGKSNHLSRNVVGMVRGTAEPARIILIGAHYDSQGMGGFISMHQNGDAIHQGADDNASGVAALLELAHYFARNPPLRTVLFVAFSGEELGLLGSNWFAENPVVPIENIKAMINLDMIGRMEDDSFSVFGTGTADRWPDIIRMANDDSLTINKVEAPGSASDHASFNRKMIPVLHYFTGTHDDYHRPGDTPDKINAQGTEKITRHVKRVVMQLDTLQTGTLSFIGTQESPQTTMRRNGVSLGVIPDYTYGGTGFRIDGVRDGETAQRAGLRSGDVIILMDDNAITDIYSYMEALNTYNPGDNAVVSVRRSGQTLRLNLQF